MPEETNQPEYIPQELLDRFRYFIQDNSLERMSRNLRKVFFDYLRQQQAGSDVDFDTILNDIEAIIEFLEFTAEETKHLRKHL